MLTEGSTKMSHNLPMIKIFFCVAWAEFMKLRFEKGKRLMVLSQCYHKIINVEPIKAQVLTAGSLFRELSEINNLDYVDSKSVECELFLWISMRLGAGFYSFHALIKYHFKNILILNDFTRVLSPNATNVCKLPIHSRSLSSFPEISLHWRALQLFAAPKGNKSLFSLLIPHNRIFFFCFDTWKAFFIGERKEMLGFECNWVCEAVSSLMYFRKFKVSSSRERENRT